MSNFLQQDFQDLFEEIRLQDAKEEKQIRSFLTELRSIFGYTNVSLKFDPDTLSRSAVTIAFTRGNEILDAHYLVSPIKITASGGTMNQNNHDALVAAKQAAFERILGEPRVYVGPKGGVFDIQGGRITEVSCPVRRSAPSSNLT